MKNLIALIWILVAYSSSLIVYGQTFDPIRLPEYTPPLDTLWKSARVVDEDNRAVTGPTWLYAGSPGLGEVLPIDESGAQSGRGFSSLVPAPGFPDWPSYPISPNVKIMSVWSDGTMGSCSGTMVGPQQVLTAGHCLVDPLGPFPNSVVAATVVPAYDYGSSPWPAGAMSHYHTFDQWSINANYEYDIAILTLSTSLGYEVGWHGTGWMSDPSQLLNPANSFHNFSYPAATFFGVPAYDAGERMYYKSGFFDFPEGPHIVGHNQEGFKGQSGSSFYGNFAQGRYTLGVLSHGGPTPVHNMRYALWDSGKLGALATATGFPTTPCLPQSMGGCNNTGMDRPETVIKVFPSPTTGKLFFEMPNPDEYNISIATLNGNRCWEETTYAEQIAIDLDLNGCPDALLVVTISNKANKSTYVIMNVD